MKRIRLLILILAGMTGCLFPACVAIEGNISGTVTDSRAGQPLAGVTITVQPPVGKNSIGTGNNGGYSVNAPQGNYTLTFEKDDFNPAEETVTVTAGQKITLNAALTPVAVAVSAGQDITAQPGETVTLRATAGPRDGSAVIAYEWGQTSGAAAILDNRNSDTVQVTLNDLTAYKEKLIGILNPEDRFAVQPVDPYALMTARTAAFSVTVTTSSGNYSDAVNVFADLPFAPAGGVADVPVGVPVLMRGKGQAGFNWQLASPANSKAALDDAGGRDPFFTPDVAGKYTVREAVSGFTVDIYAGNWVGVITGQYRSGNPLAGNCTLCHNGIDAPDKFSSWRASGHAAIFTENLESNPNYKEDCFACHTVGFNKSAKNGGFGDAPDYASFLSSGILGSPGSKNWDIMLRDFPRSARLANVQCESCHGPNGGSVLHPDLLFDAGRKSISAGVCGTCHGQSRGYGHLAQWKESAHSHFDLVYEEATVESRGATAAHCGRCHSGQGFLTWLKQGNLTAQIQGAGGNASPDELRSLGLTTDKADPQTCAVCHDPHQPGITLDVHRANTRVTGNTGLLPAGFEAKNIGYGAMCVTCHNTRNGRHNDTSPPSNFAAPHSAAQGDILMGENAYFLPGSLSSHARIADSCAACHMGTFFPPPEAGFDPSGKDHSFTASLNVCADCHGDKIDPKAIETAYANRLTALRNKMGEYLMARLPDSVSVKDITPHDYAGRSFNLKSDAFMLNKDSIAGAEPTDLQGQQGFVFKLRSPVNATYSPPGQASHVVQLTEIQAQMGDITADGKTPLIPASDVLVKAGWNYHLVHYGSSNGVHNPSWVNDVIDASVRALDSPPAVK